MTGISKTFLPHMNIQKIFMDKDKATVNGFLVVNDQAAVDFWREEDFISELVDVFFVLVHDGRSYEANLVDPNNRVSSFYNVTNPTTTSTSFENWKRGFDPYDKKIVSLRELINQDSELVVSDSSIRSSVSPQAGNIKDIAFSVDIPLSAIDFSREVSPPITGISSVTVRGPREKQEVQLYAFTHLNLQKAIEELNLSTEQKSFLNLLKIGGNFKRETILTVDASDPTQYRVPETTSMLVDEAGTPFHGTYHYHQDDDENSGFNWMEGPSDPMLPGARRLREIQIPYTKVVANFLLDDTLFISGYDGSSELNSVLDSGYNSQVQELQSRAAKVDNLFESTQGYRDTSSISVYDTKVMEQATEALFMRIAKNSDNGIIYNVQNTLAPPQEPNNIPYHSMYFSLDFERLIRTRTRYPMILERMATYYPQDAQTVFTDTRIISLRITRDRISNSPRLNNHVGSPDYGVHDPEEASMVVMDNVAGTRQGLVRTTRYSPDIVKGRYDNVFREVRPETNGDRKFEFVDWQLAHDVNYGKYEYTINLKINDVTKQIFKAKVEIFRNLIETVLSEFVARASSTSKNYDPIRAQYTDDFKSYSQVSFNSGLIDIIDAFVRLQGLLGRISSNTTVSAVKQRLEKSIIPDQNGDLESALKFSGHCKNLLKILEDLLARDPASSTTGTVSLGRKSSSGKSPKYPEFTKKIPGFVEAYTVGDVFAEYSIEDLKITSGLVESTPSRFSIVSSNNGITDIITNTGFTSLTQELQDRYNAGLENMLRTPPQLSNTQAAEIISTTPAYLPTFGIPGLDIAAANPLSKTISADVNTNLGGYNSTDLKQPLGATGTSAIKSATAVYDSEKEYKQNEKNSKKNTELSVSNKIFASLSSKIANKTLKSSKQKGRNAIASRTKTLMVMVGKSPLASFIPATLDSISNLGQENDLVTVKVDDQVGESEGKYKIISEPRTITLKKLRSMLKEASEEQTSQNNYTGKRRPF